MKVMGMVILLTVLLNLPLAGNWYVDDRYVHGVSDMRQIYPEANYEGQTFDAGNGYTATLVMHHSFTSKRLSLFEYWHIKRIGMLGDRIGPEEKKETKVRVSFVRDAL